MSAAPTCPACGKTYAAQPDEPLCPVCRQAAAEPSFWSTLTPWTIIKAVIAAAIGVVPGAIFLANGQALGNSILIMCLGAFIGAAFVLARLSPARVASLTAGAIVAHNVPRSMRDQVMESFDGAAEGKTGEKGPPKNPSQRPH